MIDSPFSTASTGHEAGFDPDPTAASVRRVEHRSSRNHPGKAAADRGGGGIVIAYTRMSPVTCEVPDDGYVFCCLDGSAQADIIALFTGTRECVAC